MAKTPAQALLDEVLKAAVTPHLRPLGFKKSSHTFRRQVERCVQVLNVQGSAWGSAEDLRFTINLGVFFPEVNELTGSQQPSAAGPTEYQCHLRTRVGRLMPEDRDVWWDLRVGDDPGAVITEVEEVVRLYGLPWLDVNGRLEAARDKVRPVDGIAMCVALGDRVEARRRFGLELETSRHAASLMVLGRSMGLVE